MCYLSSRNIITCQANYQIYRSNSHCNIIMQGELTPANTFTSCIGQHFTNAFINHSTSIKIKLKMNTYLLEQIAASIWRIEMGSCQILFSKKVSNSLADRHLWFDASIIIDCRMWWGFRGIQLIFHLWSFVAIIFCLVAASALLGLAWLNSGLAIAIY